MAAQSGEGVGGWCVAAFGARAAAAGAPQSLEEAEHGGAAAVIWVAAASPASLGHGGGTRLTLRLAWPRCRLLP